MQGARRCPAPPALVIRAARAWLGTPYHDQASLRGVGCDCLGLARGVWREIAGAEPEAVPPYSRDWGEVGRVEPLATPLRKWGIEIAPREAGPGALVLFRMRPRAVAKHCAILMATGTMIHAHEKRGVIEEPYSLPWSRRAVFAFLYPGAG